MILVLAAVGCSNAPPPRAITRVVDAAGGTLTLGTGDAIVTVPAGALATPTELGISDVPLEDLAALPAGEARGGPFALTPHGVAFAAPVEVALRHAGSDVGLSLLRLDDEGDASWEPVEGARFADGVASAATDRFSVWVVLGPIVDDCGDPSERCCTGPNPTLDDPDGDGCDGAESVCDDGACRACVMTVASLSGSCATVPAGGGECSSGTAFCRDDETMPGYYVLCCE